MNSFTVSDTHSFFFLKKKVIFVLETTLWKTFTFYPKKTFFVGKMIALKLFVLFLIGLMVIEISSKIAPVPEISTSPPTTEVSKSPPSLKVSKSPPKAEKPKVKPIVPRRTNHSKVSFKLSFYFRKSHFKVLSPQTKSKNIFYKNIPAPDKKEWLPKTVKSTLLLNEICNTFFNADV